MAERPLQENQIAPEFITEAEHGALDHSGIPGVSSVASVGAANGITNTGTAENVVVEPVYGALANTVTEGDDSRIPTQDENDALQGTDGSPSSANRYVTDSDGRLLPQVAVSSNDTTPSELLSKLVNGTGITLTELNDGSNETLQIAANPSGILDGRVKVSSNDTVFDFITTKIVSGSGINVTEVNDGGNETLSIAATGVGTDELVKITSNDTTPDFLFNKVVGGDGIATAETNDAGDEDLTLSVDLLASGGLEFSTGELAVNAGTGISLSAGGVNVDYGTASSTAVEGNDTRLEKVKVTSNDTTPNFLFSKLAEGTGITLTETNDGFDETITVAASGVGTDELVKITSNDTTPDFLFNKVVGGDGIAASETNDAGDEDLTLAVDLLASGGLEFSTGELSVNAGTGISLSAGGVDVDYGTGSGTAVEGNDTRLEKTKITSNDTTPGFLFDKVVGGDGISTTETNDAGDEDLTLAVDLLANGGLEFSTGELAVNAGTGISLTAGGVNVIYGTASSTAVEGNDTRLEKVKVSSNDTTPDFLISKIVSGTGITVTELGDPGNETLSIATTVANTDQNVKVTSNDTTSDFLFNKIVGGDGIATAETNDAGDEDLTLSVDLLANGGLEFSTGELAVNAGTGISLSAGGVNVDYGTGANTATEGNDNRLAGANGAPRVFSRQVAVGANEVFTIPAYTQANNSLQVWRNGKLQDLANSDYAETTTTTVTTISIIGDVYIFRVQ